MLFRSDDICFEEDMEDFDYSSGEEEPQDENPEELVQETVEEVVETE